MFYTLVLFLGLSSIFLTYPMDVDVVQPQSSSSSTGLSATSSSSLRASSSGCSLSSSRSREDQNYYNQNNKLSAALSPISLPTTAIGLRIASSIPKDESADSSLNLSTSLATLNTTQHFLDLRKFSLTQLLLFCFDH